MQDAPTGQSAVVVHACTIAVQLRLLPLTQCRRPSTEFAHAQLNMGQSVGVTQTFAQLPLGRHSAFAGHMAQLTDWPQLLGQAPQRPTQVAAGRWGVQHVPPWQI
jgi:hypothetical protein